MGAARTAGCLIVVLFSCYVWLLAERGRRYLVGQPERETEVNRPNTTAQSDNSSAWVDVVTNVSIIVFTFLCYDLFVVNILLFVLATDRFFSLALSRAALAGMVCVLAWAAWSETR